MLVARKKEIEILSNALNQKDAQFIAVYGRRRVGKTYLIREYLGKHFVFSHSGMYKGSYQEQLDAFSNSLKDWGLNDFHKPTNWLEAFQLLKTIINNSTKEKKVIFLDELSWMSTRNSRLINALEQFWNSYLSARKDVVLIVCGSATSWILSNVVHNKGGLYNKLTDQINLKPFSLKEVKEYLVENNFHFTDKQIIEGYMILGGIPYYWGLMRRDLSLVSNIDYLFASKNAPLSQEYNHLFRALFESSEPYIKIIEVLASGNKAGMDYSELVKLTGSTDGGSFSSRIDELEECGFVRKYYPFARKNKGTVIQLIDNFVLFYHKFLSSNPTDEHFFSTINNTSQWKSWSGLAFERVCLLHVDQIKESLKIGGVRTEVCSFRSFKDEDNGLFGTQVDLLIVRADNTINMCEMKFSDAPYVVSKDDIEKMEIRLHDLNIVSNQKYAIIPTLVVHPCNLKNGYSDEFGAIITSDELFE